MSKIRNTGFCYALVGVSITFWIWFSVMFWNGAASAKAVSAAFLIGGWAFMSIPMFAIVGWSLYITYRSMQEVRQTVEDCFNGYFECEAG